MHTHRITNLESLFVIFSSGTVGATVEPAGHLDTMSHDPAAAMLANGSEPMNGALERIEDMDVAADRMHLEGHVVVIATNFANCHGYLLRSAHIQPAPPRVGTQVE
jgi:hypothetical protein